MKLNLDGGEELIAVLLAFTCSGTFIYLPTKYVLGTVMCIPQVVLVGLWGHI